MMQDLNERESIIQKLESIIQSGVAQLTSTDVFSGWLKGAKASDGSIIIINNSFIYRSSLIKTSKNEQYLCLKVKGTEVDINNVFVGKPGGINSDFKLLSPKSANLPSLEPLDQAVASEIKRLGRLVFVLIGELQDAPAQVDINHGQIKKLRFEPGLQGKHALEDLGGGEKEIVVSQLKDPEAAWSSMEADLQREIGADLPSLETAFGAAFEKLQDEARLRLVLPAPGAPKTQVSFIQMLRQSVVEQRKLYSDALQKYDREASRADSHLREVMRIAYNFADDAIKVLVLLVSICDLKGVLLWCTLKEHFDVAEAFRNLPWTKSHKKPSLEHYREIIAGARNRAFHSLLAFDRTIEADLKGVNVEARRLILLPPYGRRKAIVPFDYEDREMVEILTELTRAPETAMPFNFWEKNAVVMESFEKLLEHTEDVLWLLNGLVRSGI